ncbi:MAG: hypothetical protein RL156_1688 [Bacteroidota bacterium]|jgi:hypothetical protein
MDESNNSGGNDTEIVVDNPDVPVIDWANIKLPEGTTYGDILNFAYDPTQTGGSSSTIKDWLSGLFKGGTSSGSGSSGTGGLSGLLGGSTLPGVLQNNAGMLTALAGLYSLMGGNKKQTAGYAGNIPRYTATQQAVQQPAGRPGGPRGRYLTDVQYRAGGGYLRGATGGMADELDTTIDDQQPAKLSHGEFVVPADVVSHLGDGNSEAGAKKLYDMMDRVRKARTGKTEQAPEIKAEKYMPKYNKGGIVAFSNGALVPTATTTGATGNIPGLSSPTQVGQTGTSTVGTLAPWAGEYVTDMLGRARALAEMPYTPYTGALTPEASGLQQKAFAGLSGLTTPTGIGAAEQEAARLGGQMAAQTYRPTTFGYEQFTPAAAQQYMNPYLQAALNPQLEEARRQAEIQRAQQAGRLTKAGAFGGSRQAIMESELARNLQQNLANITGQGYNQAYQQAANQFQADQARKAAAQQATEASRQFGSTFGMQGLQGALQAQTQRANLAQAGQAAGLRNIEAQLGAGAQQRDIESQGLAADYNRFKEERDWPYKMLQYQQSFLQGLPITATSYTADTSPLQNIIGSGTGLLALYQALAGLGQAPASK